MRCTYLAFNSSPQLRGFLECCYKGVVEGEGEIDGTGVGVAVGVGVGLGDGEGVGELVGIGTGVVGRTSKSCTSVIINILAFLL